MALSSKLFMLDMYNSKALFIKSTNLEDISLLSDGEHNFWIIFFSKISDITKLADLLYTTLFKQTLNKNWIISIISRLPIRGCSTILNKNVKSLKL